jgi:hypothetical protein
LRTVRGDAEGIPRLIDEAVSEDADERERARSELDDQLVHQGMLTEACPPAIALLTERLKRTRTPDRVGLLRFMVELTVGDPSSYLLGWPVRTRGKEKCHAAGYEASDVARRLLGTGSSEEKAAAAYLLTFYPSHGKRLAPWMVWRLRLEGADVARAGLLLCLGYWALWRGWRRTPPELRASLREESAIVRAGAAIALRGYGVLDDAVFEELARALYLRQDRRLPWCAGRLGALATALLADGTLRSTQAIAESVESPEVDEYDRVSRATILTRVAFPEGTFISGHQVRDMPALADLSEAQRVVLRVLATMPEQAFSSPAYWLQSNGLPSNQPDLRRYLGLSAPGPMDVMVAGVVQGERVKWPAHVWVRRMALGMIDGEAVMGALASHASDDEMLAAVVEGVGAYSLAWTGSLDWPGWVRLAIDVLARRRASPAALEGALDGLLSAQYFRRYDVFMLLGALARLAPALPSKYDRAVATLKESRIAQELPDVLLTPRTE